MKLSGTYLSVVIPVYRSEVILPVLYERLLSALNGKEYELIFVVDGSPDGSFNFLLEKAEKNKKVKILNLSRNFGQHYAISAGLDYAKGGFVIVMDCDLQHDPADIQILIRKQAEDNYDIVLTKAPKRYASALKKITSKMFSILVHLCTQNDTLHDTSIGAFSLISRRAVEAYKKIGDRHRHYLFILRTIGFHSVIVEVPYHPRYAGSSSYKILKLVRLALDGIISQSSAVLYLALSLGTFFILLSVLLCMHFVYIYFFRHVLSGWLSIVMLVSFFSGVILFFMGIIGIYIGKIFEQVKPRPLYIVSDYVNFSDKERMEV